MTRQPVNKIATLAVLTLFTVCFGIGMYAGELFAASTSVKSSVTVNASVGQNGENGQNGLNGANGQNGSSGTASIHVLTIVNGKTVEDYNQDRLISGGSSLFVNVSSGSSTEVRVFTNGNGSDGLNGRNGSNGSSGADGWYTAMAIPRLIVPLSGVAPTSGQSGLWVPLSPSAKGVRQESTGGLYSYINAFTSYVENYFAF
jgi:hypothetical protein